MHTRTSLRKRQPAGFTLAAVMVVMAAMLLLAVAVLAVVGIERKTARSYVDAKRAEWVAQAGMEEVRGLLREETANDDFLIVGKEGLLEESGKDLLDYLFVARGEGGGESVSYELFPLFSSEQKQTKVDDLQEIPEIESLVGDEVTGIRPKEWAQQAEVAWLPVEDAEGRKVGRYAFWVEDLQGKVDASQAAKFPLGEDGERVAWPFPAPGYKGVDLRGNEIGFLALDPKIKEDEGVDKLGERLRDGRRLLHSPDSVLAAAEIETPLERDIEGRLTDEQARVLEESAAASIQPYYERAVVPFARGISADMAGEPKLNLNALLEEGRSGAIEKFTEQIENGLPNFIERKGSFPDDYLGTLAANAFDYADEDSEGTVEEGSYRGLDAYPLVSEHLVKFRWEGLPIEDGRKLVVLSGTIYAEFWNMTDRQVSGEVEISYETNYGFSLGVIPDLNLGSAELLDDPEVADPQLKQDAGYHWLPAFDLTLEPNEYRLVNCGTVTYKIDAGPASSWVSSPIELGGDDSGESGYRMRWNGVMVDQSRDNQIRPDTQINFPLDQKTRPRQGVWSTIPGHSYSPARFDHINNMGDPRMAYYIEVAQDPNDYPDNYSPNRRTIRWGNIYQSDEDEKPKVYGRVMPSEWPDGGHNSAYGSLPAAVKAGKGGARGDERISPDDPQFFKNLPETEPFKAPMRISNFGRFFSATELGNIYDPLMWVPTFDKSSDSLAIRGGRMPKGRSRWPDVVDASPEGDGGAQYGGGNTLRIGRPEHPRFNEEPGMHAAHLLDLFHAGDPTSDEEDDWRGELEWIESRLNLNTASRDALRSLAIGLLAQDPSLMERTSEDHEEDNLMAPPTKSLELGTPAESMAADIIADAIIRERPLTCAADLARVEAIAERSGEDDQSVFGNRELYDLGDDIEWSDSAAEEVFARVYNSSTLRSRNFRVWVVGQAIVPLAEGSNAEPTVLAESRKVFTLFAAPSVRDDEGDIDKKIYRPQITHENDF